MRNVGAFGLTAGMKVADFGSGSGAYVLAMAPVVTASGHVYAVDVQRDLLRRTHAEAHKKGLEQVSVLWADLERPKATKLADRTLDLVLMSNILFQLEDAQPAFTEAWRILKPTGQLIVIDWSDSFNNMGPTKHAVVTKTRALEFARAAGFELVREFEAGAHHYGLVCRLSSKPSIV